MANRARAAVDWGAMEPDWRAGIKSVLMLSKEYGVSRAAILKHWAKVKVERDLAARIKARADALVTRSTVTPPVTVGDTVTETAIVEANAQMQADRILAHRSYVVRMWEVFEALLAEVSEQTVNRELYEQLGELLRSEDPKGEDKLNDLYRKIIGTPSRVDECKKLAETGKIVIALDREAFGIESMADPLAEAIREIRRTVVDARDGRLVEGQFARLMPE